MGDSLLNSSISNMEDESENFTHFLAAEQCPPYGTYPTSEQFAKALDVWAITLYVYSAVVVLVLALEYGLLVGHFLAQVPTYRQVPTLWVNSVYLVVAVFTMFSVALPQASDFVWLFYKVYLGMAMGYFVQLTMSWYGGETAMIQHIDGELVNFRIPPCCCCMICPKAAALTKKRIRFMKAMVYQMPYIQAATLFVMSVLQLAGFLQPGNMSPREPYLYLTIILAISFMLGIWGLFVFMDITHRHKLLVDYQYRVKSMLLKLIVVFVNVQGILIDILCSYGVINCIPPFISANAVGSIIKSVCCLTESIDRKSVV